MAALFLLAFNSLSIKIWVDEQTPGPWQSRAASFATDWHARMTALGLAAPRAALNRLWVAAEAAGAAGDQR